ncbi:hypothetical protein [Paenibacillus sp. V4I5]|uniref:hypothetical protein n=1 Tax=Paenibacillus sp. V4I5 TaxID=3042306 RepID=UPI0027D79ED4|nr:hypothetical protein [Paenibacillus sp. V4I5]
MNNINFKIKNLESELDALTDVIPGGVEIDWHSRQVIDTYFIAASEEEYKEIKEDIIAFVELLIELYLKNMLTFMYLLRQVH